MTDDLDRFRPALEEAMDAAREVFRAHGHGELAKGALFLELEDPEGQRLAGSWPQGDFLVSSELAYEAAQAYSIRAAMDALGREELPDA